MKKLTGFLLSVLTTLSLGMMTSCQSGGDNSTPTTVIEATNITFRATGYDEGQALYMQRGQKILVAATITPSNASDKTVAWSTSNFDIAVTPHGDTSCYIEAFDLGDATITAKVGTYEKSIEVKCVAAINPTGLTVATDKLVIPASTKKRIEYTVLPENATNKTIAYSVAGKNGASTDMISLKLEDDGLYVTVEQLATIGDLYEATLRPVANVNVKATVTIEVAALEIESMHFKTDTIDLKLSDPMYRVLPVFEPLKTSYTDVRFATSDASICEVDATGALKPLKAGSVTITATNTHNEAIKCEATVNITDGESAYLTRLLKKDDVTNLAPVSYTMMDFENDKIAFAAWKKVVSEDSNAGSHISDAGWAIWMVGFDTYDDDNSNTGGDANTLVYCKVNVPAAATKMQYIFRSHPHPDDYAKFRIRGVTPNNELVNFTDWTTFHQTEDMFINIDVTPYQGQAITFIVEQDQMGHKLAGSFMNVNLMFRRCLFDNDTSDRFVDDDAYSILGQGNN